jgi:zinc-finger of transposase IS204/IS1001/IS1096/IS1165
MGDGENRVKVQPVDLEEGCPECGVVSSRVHAWSVQRVRDVPHAGRAEVVVRKPRLACVEPACGRRTFTPVTDQLPARARCTTRLRTRVLAAVIDSGRANLMVSRVRQRLIREREQRRGARSTRPGRTEPCWSADTTRCPPGPGPASITSSPSTTPPRSCRRPGASKNNSADSCMWTQWSRPAARR